MRQYWEQGRTAQHCYDGLFMGTDGNGSTLKNIQRIYRLFSTEGKEQKVLDYIVGMNRRGPALVEEFWYDDAIELGIDRCSSNLVFKNAAIDLYGIDWLMTKKF